MQYFLLFALISIAAVQLSIAPPVNQKGKHGEHNSKNEVEDAEEMADIMEYRRYLMEVVQVLESDPDFSAKLKKANEEDILTGKIAEQLQFVNHNIRSRLDELKRAELERLRHLATKEKELKNRLNIEIAKIAEHLDHTNMQTFEIQDLKKLIVKTAKDLADADKMRREEFKQHEMQKKYEEQEKLKKMNDEEKQKYKQELEALKEKHNKHEPVHHPGSKQQLEEVWEKQDHMEAEDFNPKTFFFMHDIDSNGVWDQDEVKVLFLRELDKLYTKLYAEGASQDDILKRTEEMERMREHVFNEIDIDKDGLISYLEFLVQTKKPDFQRDEGWQTLDEQQIYTQEEYESFQRHKQQEMQQKISEGMLSPHSGSIPTQHGSFQPQYPNAAIPPQQYVDPRGPNQNLPHQQFQGQEHPQQYQQQHVVNPQQPYPNVPAPPVPQQPYHPQLSQPQQFQGQVPLNQQIPQNQQIPLNQQIPQQGQVPVQQQQGQILAQQQGQVPIQQKQEQIPVQQKQEHVPVQQKQEQVPVQKQNTVNQIPHNAQNNAVPRQNNPSQLNSQPAQVPIQQEVNRNKLQTAEKV